MYEIPKQIVIDKQSYVIRSGGDYRMILDCFSVLDDIELTMDERILTCLIIFYEKFNCLDDVLADENVPELARQMFLFFNCGEEQTDSGQSRKLMDWEEDSQLICAAVNKVANTEIRSVPYMHWWTFMGYYMSIGECLYSTIISIRDKIVSGKKLEKHEKEFKQKNPKYFTWNSKTTEQQEADAWLKNVWNSGK